MWGDVLSFLTISSKWVGSRINRGKIRSELPESPVMAGDLCILIRATWTPRSRRIAVT